MVQKSALPLLRLNIALQTADGLTTYYLLHHGGAEVNPLVAALFPTLGIAATLMVAKAVGGALAAFLWYRHRSFHLSVRPLFVLTGLMDAVVSWNLVMVLLG